jgi:HlyD family secretion protein
VPRPGEVYSQPFRYGTGRLLRASRENGLAHFRKWPLLVHFSLMKRAIFALFALALAASTAWIAWRGIFARGGPQSELLVSGNIEAHESLVSFKAVQSRIVELPFDEGQWVEVGTVLARLDDADYLKQVEVNEAAVGVAQRQLQSATEKVDVARATIANDRADLAQRQLNYNRRQRLFAANAIAAEDRDLALTALKQAQAALQRDIAAWRAAGRDVEVARASLHDTHKKLELSKVILNYTTLRAPFSGVILVRNAELGEVMQPGTPVVTLADLNHVWLRAYIGETDLGKVRWGQDAVLTTDTYPGKKYHGYVSFIASNAEFTPKSVETHKERVTLVYRIKIDVENPRHELKPGMPADALIELNSGGPQRDDYRGPQGATGRQWRGPVHAG